MKIYTSYFYHVRHLRPYQIPISTAKWDPKWYHQFKDKNHVWIDDNGVINGLRIEWLAPGDSCSGLCHGKDGCNFNPKSCQFLRVYRDQLSKLNFNELIDKLNSLGVAIKYKLGFTQDPEFILLLHEATDNPCSERTAIQDWFKSNGVEVLELDF